MGKFGLYAAKASPTTSDKLLIDDVADGTTGTGLEKVITIGQLAKVVAGASSITVNASNDMTGATDTAAINAALSSFGGAGGLVTLGAGNYYLSAPLILPAGVRLTGVAANTNDTSALGVTLNITSTWAQGAAPYGAAILATGVDSAVDTLNLNGGYPAFAVDGIWGSGNCVHVRDVSVYHGFTNGYVPAGVSWRMERCTASTCYQYGWWGVGTDNDYVDCIANANTSHGWYIKNPINTHLIGCRSEWNTGGYGFYVTGDTTATGGGSLVSCSTDRNAQHGLYVDSTGTWPLLVSGMTFRRDGSSGGSYGAVTVAAACTSPVILDGITVFPGFNDDGSGSDTPITGITVTAGATYVSVDNAVIHAVTTPVSGTITAVGGNVGTRTGAWNSPSGITLLTPTMGGGGSGTVTTVSVATANGFSGTVATATTTPAITMQTTVTGVLKGNGTAVSAATAGTDYLSPAGGTLTGFLAPAVATLTDGSSVAINAANGNDFRWTLGGASHTLAAPSNPVNGQPITIAIKYSGAFTPLFNAVFDFGAAGHPAWTATSGKTDYVGFRYDSALAAGAGAWAYQGSVLGLTS